MVQLVVPRDPAHGVAARQFDLDDRRAHICQQTRAIGAWQVPRQINDGIAIELT